MFKYLFDDTRFLFYARGHTGFWEKFIPKKSAFAKKMEQFYGQAITEKKKLNSNCMAFIFLYALYRFVPDEFEKGFFRNKHLHVFTHQLVDSLIVENGALF